MVIVLLIGSTHNKSVEPPKSAFTVRALENLENENGKNSTLGDMASHRTWRSNIINRAECRLAAFSKNFPDFEPGGEITLSLYVS